MLEDTYGHTPLQKMFDLKDVYGIGYDENRASRPTIRLGIIGAGGVSQSKHIPAVMRLKTIWEPIDLVAISIRRKEQGEKVASMYNCCWYPDYKDMIKNEQLDGVIVATPDACHFEQAMYCLEAGLAVLQEKPFTLLLSEGRALCEYAEKRGLVLMTVSQKRFTPPYLRAKKFVEGGPVSNPALFVGKFNLGYEYVNLLEDGTVHLFDLVRYFMGDVSEVHSIGVNKYKGVSYPIDNMVSDFKFTSGSVGVITTSSTALSLKPWERVEIYAKHKWLAVEDQVSLLLYDSEDGPIKSWLPVWTNSLLFDEEFGGYMGLIENFAQSIRGIEKPLVTGWDGYKAYELSVASHLSFKRGTSVRIPLDTDTDNEIKELLGL